MTDEELAQRACVLVHTMLRDCARYLSGRVSFEELNEVMFEAEKRGWYTGVPR